MGSAAMDFGLGQVGSEKPWFFCLRVVCQKSSKQESSIKRRQPWIIQYFWYCSFGWNWSGLQPRLIHTGHQDPYKIWARLAHTGHWGPHKTSDLALSTQDIRVHTEHQDPYRIWFRLAHTGHQSPNRTSDLALSTQDIRVHTGHQDPHRIWSRSSIEYQMQSTKLSLVFRGVALGLETIPCIMFFCFAFCCIDIGSRSAWVLTSALGLPIILKDLNIIETLRSWPFCFFDDEPWTQTRLWKLPPRLDGDAYTEFIGSCYSRGETRRRRDIWLGLSMARTVSK